MKTLCRESRHLLPGFSTGGDLRAWPRCRLACSVAGVLAALLSHGPWDQKTSAAAQPPIVALELEKKTYDSCELVSLRVRNATDEHISVEAYVDDLQDGAWTATWCQYNLLDPGGRLVKRFRPTPIAPQGTLVVRYDRCADYALCVRPKLPNTPTRQLHQMLAQEDARATPPVSQRIRVDVYTGSGASLKEKGRFWSPAFTRSPQTTVKGRGGD
jgi:hypothetical protein